MIHTSVAMVLSNALASLSLCGSLCNVLVLPTLCNTFPRTDRKVPSRIMMDNDKYMSHHQYMAFVRDSFMEQKANADEVV